MLCLVFSAVAPIYMHSLLEFQPICETYNKFKKSLDELMTSLYRCHPFFVRCVKPNEDKKALVYDRYLLLPSG